MVINFLQGILLDSSIALFPRKKSSRWLWLSRFSMLFEDPFSILLKNLSKNFFYDFFPMTAEIQYFSNLTLGGTGEGLMGKPFYFTPTSFTNNKILTHQVPYRSPKRQIWSTVNLSFHWKKSWKNLFSMIFHVHLNLEFGLVFEIIFQSQKSKSMMSWK